MSTKHTKLLNNIDNKDCVVTLAWSFFEEDERILLMLKKQGYNVELFTEGTRAGFVFSPEDLFRFTLEYGEVEEWELVDRAVAYDCQ